MRHNGILNVASVMTYCSGGIGISLESTAWILNINPAPLTMSRGVIFVHDSLNPGLVLLSLYQFAAKVLNHGPFPG